MRFEHVQWIRSLTPTLCLWGALLAGCDPKSSGPADAGVEGESESSSPPSFTAMTHRLAEVSNEADWRYNPYLADRRVNYWKGYLASNPPREEKGRLLFRIVDDFIRANENREAIALLETIRVSSGLAANRIAAQNQLDMRLGVAWLRLGERQNCVEHHTGESCIFPIRAGGIHQHAQGSTKAREYFARVLGRDPGHLDARWLYNIAAMTLGEYPDGVPEEILLPESLFASAAEFPRFPEVARSAGIDVNGLAGGGAVVDFNNDHILDLCVSSCGLDDQTRLFFGRGDGTFADATGAAGLTGMIGGLNLICADYDNNGFPDIFILRGGWMGEDGRHPNSLLRNNGDGTFTEVTEEAGLLSFHPTQSGVWMDYNNDGWVDLFIGNEPDGSTQPVAELYRNNRDGTFTECAAEAGLAEVVFTKGCASADYNNDGRIDLFISVYGGTNRLMKNMGPDQQGVWRFEDVAAAAGVERPSSSFPCWFWDFDNDGWEDLFVGAGNDMQGIGQMAAAYLGLPVKAQNSVLYRNNRQGGFEDVTAAAGITKGFLPMGVNFGDLDNDGLLDFYLGTGMPSMACIMPNRMYRNTGHASFEDITHVGGFGHLQKGHAVSFADFDNDGDQDVHIVMGGIFPGDAYMNALFRNPGTKNSWIKLKLQGKTSNRSAIGARLRLDVVAAEGVRSIHRTVGTGGSFGCNPLRQEIGIGAATSIKQLIIDWPATGRTQVILNLKPNTAYEVFENSDRPVEIDLPRLYLD